MKTSAIGSIGRLVAFTLAGSLLFGYSSLTALDFSASVGSSSSLFIRRACLLDRYSYLTGLVIARRPAERTRPILILQHMPDKTAMHLASIAMHRTYARIHGYRYRKDDGQDVKTTVRRRERTNNKLYAIRRALRDELVGGAAGWIFVTDVDTFVTDPLIPLHSLLPPSSLEPRPYILGNQDHNGFNSGALFIRVHQEVLDYFDRAIEHWELIQDDPDRPVMTDQSLMQLVWQEDPGFASHFYEIPKAWTNAYHPEESWYRLSMQVHLVNKLKEKRSWLPLVQLAVDRMEEELEREEWRNSSRGVTAYRGKEDWADEVGKTWWHGAQGGMEHITFLWDY